MRSSFAKTFARCSRRSRLGNAQPSSCSTCTTTTQGRPHGSWVSVHRPFAPSPHKAGLHSALREARMPDLREVFEMVKQQTQADTDSWSEQEQRMRQAARKRKIGALALVAAIIVAAVVLVVRNLDDPGSGVAPASNAPPSNPSSVAAPTGLSFALLDLATGETQGN